MTRSEPKRPPRPFTVASIGVAIAAVATFARGVPSPLLRTWDDGRFVLEFAPVRHVSWQNLRAIWSQPHFEAWHPLHLMSYWLDVPWAGPSGPALHCTNLALWVVGLVLVLRVMQRLGLPLGIAAVATLAYGLHPVQVEAVSWATGRKEALALLFAAAATLAHLSPTTYFARADWQAARGRERAKLLLRRSRPLLLFGLGALSKTSVLPLPAVLVLLDVLLREVPWRRALGRQVPLLLVAAGLSVGVVQLWHAEQMVRLDAAGGDPAGRAGLVAATFTHGLGTLLWPAYTAPLYPIARSADFGPVDWIGPLALLTAGAIAWRLRLPRLGFVVAAFVVLMGPVSNAIPLYYQYQDRYLSLPLLPFAFGLGVVVHQLQQRARSRGARALAVTAAAVVVVALGARTVAYQAAWSADGRLWDHATRTHPDAFYAWLKLGEHRRDHGELDAAMEAYQRAVQLQPTLRLGHTSLFYTLALRDERDHVRATGSLDLSWCIPKQRDMPRTLSEGARGRLRRSAAWEASLCYHANLNSPQRLRRLAGTLVGHDYRDAVRLALAQALQMQPAGDQKLERAAAIQLRNDRRWLARFYVQQMSRPPFEAELRPLWQEMRGQ